MNLQLFDIPPSHKTRDPGKPFAEPEERNGELIRQLIGHYSHVLVKKLALNDRQWAIWDETKKRWKSNQAGPYLPAEARTSGFFPPLIEDPETAPNSSADVSVFWPTTGRIYQSRFIWYKKEKGNAEHHFTTNPRSEFTEIAPASYLLMFKPKAGGEMYAALTVNAADEELTEYITEVFGIDADFHFRIFDTSVLDPFPRRSVLQELIAELVAQLLAGPTAFDAYVRTLRRRSAAAISAAAYDQWKQETGNADLDPYRILNIGDVIFELTRVREFALYKVDEAKTYGATLVQALLGGGRQATPQEIVRACVERFDDIYNICLRASQARSSRVGGTFETHMHTALSAGNIPHSPQSIFEGSRPDFVLPAGATYADLNKRSAMSLILTLKTTLKERWRQVVSESTGCPLYLGTLDESVTSETLDQLERHKIILVVPERFKSSEFAEYSGRAGVISYREFFDQLLADRAGQWRSEGFECFRTAVSGSR
jgi:hypothetical protein